MRASLYVQCRRGYRTDGPEALRPVGEIDWVLAQAAPDGYTPGTFNLPAALALTKDRAADYDANAFTYLANFAEDPNTVMVAANS